MTVDFQELRVKMVDGQVRTTDVTDAAILDAMLAVPREAFVPAARRAFAYIDEDIELDGSREGGARRFLMEPSPFARLVQLAGVKASDTVLDVGCASGYSSAVFSQLAGSIVALESDPVLASQAREALAAQGCDTVSVVEGPLAAGHPARAPYDVIFVNGAVDEVTPALFDQLADRGRLVAVIGTGNAGRATLHVKENGLVSARHAFNAAVRPLDEFRRAPAFEF
jgi:protein-L-isoaspartate(D-aspartate) O-methyltransferase